MELAFAGLHQLCVPFLDRLDDAARPRSGTRSARRSACGRAAHRTASSSGLAVLTPARRVAEEQPLICVVDDAQWLDQASALTLEFVARRLAAEPVAIVFAVRELRPGADG